MSIRLGSLCLLEIHLGIILPLPVKRQWGRTDQRSCQWTHSRTRLEQKRTFMINALPELSPLITMSFGGRNFTGEEIRELIELAHVSHLASHWSRLFAVPVTNTSILYIVATLLVVLSPTVQEWVTPEVWPLVRASWQMAQQLAGTMQKKKSHDETGSQIMKPWLLFYNYHPQRTSLPRTNSLPSDLIMTSVAQLLCTNPSFLKNLTLLSMVHLSFSHLNLCRTQAIVQPMQG